jgi:hypothetical protein
VVGLAGVVVVGHPEPPQRLAGLEVEAADVEWERALQESAASAGIPREQASE